MATPSVSEPPVIKIEVQPPAAAQPPTTVAPITNAAPTPAQYAATAPAEANASAMTTSQPILSAAASAHVLPILPPITPAGSSTNNAAATTTTTTTSTKLEQRITTELEHYPLEWQTLFVDYKRIQTQIKQYIGLYRRWKASNEQAQPTQQQQQQQVDAAYQQLRTTITQQCTTFNTWYTQTESNVLRSNNLTDMKLLQTYCILYIEVLVKLCGVLDSYTQANLVQSVNTDVQKLEMFNRSRLQRAIGEEEWQRQQQLQQLQLPIQQSAKRTASEDAILANTSVEAVDEKEQLPQRPSYPVTNHLHSPPLQPYRHPSLSMPPSQHFQSPPHGQYRHPSLSLPMTQPYDRSVSMMSSASDAYSEQPSQYSQYYSNSARPYDDDDDDNQHSSDMSYSANSQGHRNSLKPRGFSCHQCKSTKSSHLLLFCTNRGEPSEQSKKGKKCRKKFCNSCLRRWYNTTVYDVTPENIKTYKCPACFNRCQCATCRRRNGLPQQMQGLDDSLPLSDAEEDEHTQYSTENLHALTNMVSPTSETGIGNLNLTTPSNAAAHKPSAVMSTARMQSNADAPPPLQPSVSPTNSHPRRAESNGRMKIVAPRLSLKRSRQNALGVDMGVSKSAMTVSSASRAVSMAPDSKLQHNSAPVYQPPSLNAGSRAVSDGRWKSHEFNDQNRPSKTPRNSMMMLSPEQHSKKWDNSSVSPLATPNTLYSTGYQWMKRDSLVILPSPLAFNSDDLVEKGAKLPMMSIVVPGSKSSAKQNDDVPPGLQTPTQNASSFLQPLRRPSLSQSNQVIAHTSAFVGSPQFLASNSNQRKMSITALMTPFTPLGGNNAILNGSVAAFMSPTNGLQTPASPFLNQYGSSVQQQVAGAQSTPFGLSAGKAGRRGSWSLAL